MATTVPALATTTSFTTSSNSATKAVPNDPRVHKFNTDDAVVDDDGKDEDDCRRRRRPQEEEEEENSNSEWKKGYVPRASIRPTMRKGSVYANLIFRGAEGIDGNSEMASDGRSWHMRYLKVLYSYVDIVTAAASSSCQCVFL